MIFAAAVRTVVTDVVHKSVLRALLSRKNHDRSSIVRTIIKPAKKRRDRAKGIEIQNRHNDSINSNLNLDLGFSEIKVNITAPNRHR